MITEEQRQALEKLRRPFPKSAIGKRPAITCPACELVDRDQPGDHCVAHSTEECATCGYTLTVAHEDLDYVGHAHVRARFLEVDPGWEWEPVAVAENGTPAFDEFGGLWIRLTVAGVTRLGYGDAEGRKGADARKETIGNALRNAAMSFGVALDLWKKQSRRRRRRAAGPWARADAQAVRARDAEAVRREIRNYAERRFGWKLPQIDGDFTHWVGGAGGATFGTASVEVLDRYRAHLESFPEGESNA